MSAQIRLSMAQMRVVEFGDGPLLVVAGPGSGKTRVLTERVRRLLTETKGHFRVLAITFTNKAANELTERLKDLGDLRQRAFIGTLHSFCLEMLAERGKPVGVAGLPQIFELPQDRRQVMLEAATADPVLAHELANAGDARQRDRRIGDWLRAVAFAKTHPITHPVPEDPLEGRILEAYNAGLRASGGYDFDDLLLLAYRLLTENPKVADFYRRLFRYICVDEAQDLNEAQYAVLESLCGDDFKNVMMVGDPKQSIYGFNASGPEYMQLFVSEFGAQCIELTENFRSSKSIVEAAKALEPSYVVAGQLPIRGAARVLVGSDEKDEANLVVDEISRLIANGHPDIEGAITPAKCAILGRTQYTLLATEAALKERGIPFYKRLSAVHENESDIVEDFQLALRLAANPRDKLHLATLAKRWALSLGADAILQASDDVFAYLRQVAGGDPTARCQAVIEAVESVTNKSSRLDLMPAINILQKYADAQPQLERRAVYDDTAVILGEWDQYLRSGSSSRSIAGFLSQMALGTTQQINRDGVALLTVHSSKGLEFDVVFLVGMAEGVFPDYRAEGKQKEMEEERRNAFVAVTRSKRLLYLSYPSSRQMPWGDVWKAKPSRFLHALSTVIQS